MHTPWLAQILPVSFAITALIVTVFALRGRRVDDHPICRRCGFDLFGKPPSTTICGECGADLHRGNAVRNGRREKRLAQLLLELMILIPCLIWEAYWGWRTIREIDWYQGVPAWVIVRHAHSTNVARRDRALAELARRISAGKIDRQQESALVDEAMVLQADLGRPWIQGWGLS